MGKTSGIDRGLLRMNELLICPRYGEKLALNMMNRDKLYYECPKGHRYPVIEGVIDFNTREINGELWSLYYKNYQQYLETHDWSNVNPNFKRGKPIDQLIGDKILELKPKIILDIASGAGSCVEFYLPRIHWPCTVILTDLSHRILKWDRQYFTEKYHNPYVDMVFMACDCAALPLIGNSVDCVTSLAGFESMQPSEWMDSGKDTAPSNPAAIPSIPWRSSRAAETAKSGFP